MDRDELFETLEPYRRAGWILLALPPEFVRLENMPATQAAANLLSAQIAELRARADVMVPATVLADRLVGCRKVAPCDLCGFAARGLGRRASHGSIVVGCSNGHRWTVSLA